MLPPSDLLILDFFYSHKKTKTAEVNLEFVNPKRGSEGQKMITNEIDIETTGGVMNTFIIHPDENGPFPMVLFLMDAPGKREELHDMASRIAASGYYVMLPNLYYRKTRTLCFRTDFIWPQENVRTNGQPHE